MENHRGRPPRTERDRILKAVGARISAELRHSPLREPIDQEFQPFLERISNGDIKTLLDYQLYGAKPEFHGSFFELVGRLTFMQSIPGVSRIVSQLSRRGDESVNFLPPDYVVYQYWYKKLKPLCDHARKFIRQTYQNEDDRELSRTHCRTREKLWTEYICKFFTENAARRISGLNSSLAATRSPVDRWTLYDLVDRCSLLGAVPKTVFFALAESERRAGSPSGRDRRYRYRRFRRTPSGIAREFACKVAGMSVSAISHSKPNMSE